MNWTNAGSKRIRFVWTSLLLLFAVAGFARAELIHRYSFISDASDSIGTAHGVARQIMPGGTPAGTPVTFNGAAVLDGVGGYIDLPNGLISGLSNVTIEVWFTWNGGNAWQRVFDIGNSDAGEDVDGSKAGTGTGQTYLFLTPSSGSTTLRCTISDRWWEGERPVLDAEAAVPGFLVHAAVTYGADGARLYAYGRQEAAGATELPLSAVVDENVWLGRAQYGADPLFAGTIDELRIHNSILSGPEIAASYQAGPDVISYEAGSPTFLSIILAPQVAVDGVAIPEVSAYYDLAGEVLLGGTDYTLTVDDPSVLEVLANGTVRGKNPGSTMVTAEFQGFESYAFITVVALPATLKNRYSFSETEGATQVVDSISGANGTAYSAAEAITAGVTNTIGLGTGKAVFPGGQNYRQGAYIDLPDGIVSSKNNLTIETWVTWNGPSGSYWQRIFDFGNSSKADNNPHNGGSGLNYFFLTPYGGAQVVRFVGMPANGAETILDGQAFLPVGQESHVVCIYAPELAASQLWVNGTMVDSGPTPFAVAAVEDVNNWLGVAQYNDPPFNGAINEFRIYEGALTEIEIALSRRAGPDTLFQSPGLLQSVDLTVPPLLLSNQTAAQAVFLANFENAIDVDVSGLSRTEFTSSDTGIFTVTGSGALRPVNVGTADLVATYENLSATTSVTVLAPTALYLAVPSPQPSGGPPTGVTVTADYPDQPGVNILGFAGISFSSGDTTVATIGATSGTIVPYAVGTATISVDFAGMQATAELRVETPASEPVALVHRYSFSEQPGSTVVADSEGDADGELINPTIGGDFDGNGRLIVSGGAWDGTPQSAYVNLPNGLVSQLSSVSIEGWIRWAGPADSSWQRIFDFGRNSAVDAENNFVEDTYGNPGLSYMFLCPRSGNNTYRFAIKQGADPEDPIVDATTLPVGADVHVAVVYDTAISAVRLYANGERVGTGRVVLPLSAVEDLNVWLGRSQWTDSYFAGEYDEFRIYSGALLDEQVAMTYAAGPDTVPDLAPAPNLTARLSQSMIEIAWPVSATGYMLESTGILGTAADWQAVPGDPVVEDEMNKVVIQPTDAAQYFRLKK